MTNYKRYALFIDFKFIGKVFDTNEKGEYVSMLQALCSHQFRNANDKVRTYTALSVSDGYAFSQTYSKIGEERCSHGNMFKHEDGQTNPESPSYCDLVAQL
jgi:hypothetical protein